MQTTDFCVHGFVLTVTPRKRSGRTRIAMPMEVFCACTREHASCACTREYVGREGGLCVHDFVWTVTPREREGIQCFATPMDSTCCLHGRLGRQWASVFVMSHCCHSTRERMLAACRDAERCIFVLARKIW